MNNRDDNVVAIVPAAGIGSRMKAELPKQYLPFLDKTLIEYTLMGLVGQTNISKVVVPLHQEDIWFNTLEISQHPKIEAVLGGSERSDSVLAGLKVIHDDAWVLVHDAARPCLRTDDLQTLIQFCLDKQQGAILATPVRDTMKQVTQGVVEQTIDRSKLWHALTPQMFQAKQLNKALDDAINNHHTVTDEASAIELAKLPVNIIEASSTNIKVTHPEDLAIAELFYQQGNFNV